VTKYTEVPFTPITEIPPKFADYTMYAPDGVNCMFGDPAVLPPASHCGYMCNDPHACIFPPGSSLAECRQLATQYVWNHKKEPANLAFIDLKTTLGTVRQVSAGEELCIEYGIEYWLQWNVRHSSRILQKVFAILISEELGYTWWASIPTQVKIHACGILPDGPMMTSLGLSGATPDEQWEFLSDYAHSGGR
jgi:hypothetical protein